jgi:hypothetical protein
MRQATVHVSDPSSVGLTRRRLLASGGAAGAAAFAALNPQFAWAETVIGRDPAYLRRSTYAPLVGQDFTASWWGRSARLTLADVGDLPGGLAGRDDAFSLFFTGAPGIAGGSLTVTHPRVGRFPLFFGPVDARARVQDYEAVVNRSVGVTHLKPPKPHRHRHARPPAPAHDERHEHRLVRHAEVERTLRGIRAHVEFAHHEHVHSSHAWLRRHGRVLTTTAPGQVHDHRVALLAETDGRLRRGDYELVVAAGERLESVAVKLR